MTRKVSYELNSSPTLSESDNLAILEMDLLDSDNPENQGIIEADQLQRDSLLTGEVIVTDSAERELPTTTPSPPPTPTVNTKKKTAAKKTTAPRTAPPAPTVLETPESRPTDKGLTFNYARASVEQDAQSMAHMYAEKKISDTLEEPKKGILRKWAKRAFVGNVLRTYYTAKYKEEYRQKVAGTYKDKKNKKTDENSAIDWSKNKGQIYAPVLDLYGYTPEEISTRSSEALGATISRMLDKDVSFDEYKRQGESTAKIAENDAKTQELKAAIKRVIISYCETSMSEDQLIHSRDAEFAKIEGLNDELFAKHIRATDNIIQIANDARKAKDVIGHEEGMDRVRAALDNMDVNGFIARSGVDAYGGPTKFDKLSSWVHSHKLGGPALATSIVLGAGLSLAVGKKFAQSTLSKALFLTGIGSAAAGVVSAINENMAFKREVAFHEQERALGIWHENGENSNPRRNKLKQLDDIAQRTSATEAILKMQEFYGKNPEGKVVIKDNLTDQQLIEASTLVDRLDSIRKLEAEGKLGLNVGGLDPFVWDGIGGDAIQRMDLLRTLASLKVALKSVEDRVITSLEEYNGQKASEAFDANRQTVISDVEEEKSKTQSDWDKAFNKMRAKRVAGAFFLGWGAGFVGSAAVIYGVHGVTSMLNQDTVTSIATSTVSASSNIMNSSPDVPQVSLNGQPHVVSSEKFIDTYKEVGEIQNMKITSNATNEYGGLVGDHNELAIQKGGENGTWIDKQGNVKVNVDGITKDGSWSGNQEYNVPKALAEGRAYMTFVVNNEHHENGVYQSMRFQVQKDGHGSYSAIIPQDSPIRGWFSKDGYHGPSLQELQDPNSSSLNSVNSMILTIDDGTTNNGTVKNVSIASTPGIHEAGESTVYKAPSLQHGTNNLPVPSLDNPTPSDNGSGGVEGTITGDQLNTAENSANVMPIIVPGIYSRRGIGADVASKNGDYVNIMNEGSGDRGPNTTNVIAPVLGSVALGQFLQTIDRRSRGKQKKTTAPSSPSTAKSSHTTRTSAEKSPSTVQRVKAANRRSRRKNTEVNTSSNPSDTSLATSSMASSPEASSSALSSTTTSTTPSSVPKKSKLSDRLNRRGSRQQKPSTEDRPTSKPKKEASEAPDSAEPQTTKLSDLFNRRAQSQQQSDRAETPKPVSQKSAKRGKSSEETGTVFFDRRSRGQQSSTEAPVSASRPTQTAKSTSTNLESSEHIASNALAKVLQLFNRRNSGN